jgi:uncharacterized membrane protein
MRKATGIAALVGLTLVILSMLSNYFHVIPSRDRMMILIIGFTIMFLATIWRVVTDMNQKEED